MMWDDYDFSKICIGRLGCLVNEEDIEGGDLYGEIVTGPIADKSVNNEY